MALRRECLVLNHHAATYNAYDGVFVKQCSQEAQFSRGLLGSKHSARDIRAGTLSPLDGMSSNFTPHSALLHSPDGCDRYWPCNSSLRESVPCHQDISAPCWSTMVLDSWFDVVPDIACVQKHSIAVVCRVSSLGCRCSQWRHSTRTGFQSETALGRPANQ